MNGIQRLNRSRKRLQGTPQHWRYHFDDGIRADQTADGVAVRVLKPTRVDPVPDFALEQPTWNNSFIPLACQAVGGPGATELSR